MATNKDDEFSRPEDYQHTSGPQDMARLLKGTGTRLIKATKPEGRVDTWRPTKKRS